MRYVGGTLLRLPSFVKHDLKLQEEIKGRIVESENGRFWLAQLHLNSLQRENSPETFLNAPTRLPKGPDAYDAIYKDAMERPESSSSAQEGLAKRVLLWVTCAKRSLAVSEIQQALAVRASDSEIDKGSIPKIEGMISACSGLVTVDEESGIIRLIYGTAQEYLERNQKRWFPNLDEYIGAICLTYLSLCAFENGYCRSDTDFGERLEAHPLYSYASQY
ncbi:ankyrin repeat protein [Acephala macrosclerotiorum]|nr:ankyrin repeat protein [Acephala macrosclerotiorum]